MTTKQQIATGFLALMIVGSVALMPASAGGRNAAPAARGAVKEAAVAVKTTASELDQDQVRDLTYN